MASSSWLPVAGAVAAVLGSCIAGGIGFASTWFTLRKQREVTELTLVEQQKTAAETLGHQRDQLFNERFATAADKLGHAQAATRLAGVYALASLADDWVTQQQSCIDALCGYMRLPYHTDPTDSGYRDGEREVRLSIISLIRDHLREGARSSWQGRIFRLHRVTFDGGDLSKIRVSGGYVSFYRAQFVSGILDMRGSVFSGGSVDFQRAEFSAGTVDLRHAKFVAGGRVIFPEIILSCGRIDLRNSSFAGGTVDLNTIALSSGTIDLREPVDNSTPPEIPKSPPPGMLCPS